MKSKIVQTVCNLIDDDLYTKDDAVHALLEVVSIIELGEKRIHPDKIRHNVRSGK
ncbi:hypothetical protein [Bacillus sp. FSL K6-3431]|uniref:hypothetical protein n=1 Tax=Bacillus sp. FSL K6-3431 TaxID=2921500 RepID=UPI0030F8852C